MTDARALSPRKAAIRAMGDRLAPERDAWIERNAFYYSKYYNPDYESYYA